MLRAEGLGQEWGRIKERKLQQTESLEFRETQTLKIEMRKLIKQNRKSDVCVLSVISESL